MENQIQEKRSLFMAFLFENRAYGSWRRYVIEYNTVSEAIFKYHTPKDYLRCSFDWKIDTIKGAKYWVELNKKWQVKLEEDRKKIKNK